MAVYHRLRVYISKDTYNIEPVQFDSLKPIPRLVLHRDTGEINVYSSATSVPLGYYHETLEVDGILGLVPLLGGDYLILITRKRHVGRLFPDSHHCVYAVDETRILPIHRTVPSLSDIEKRDEIEYLSLLERACKMSHMYFSPTWDLTSCTQTNFNRLLNDSSVPLWQCTDRRFFWNHYLQSKLIQLSDKIPELNNFIFPVICGYVKIVMAELNRKVIQYALITRKRIHRVGTRYHSRGIDNQGYVSNYAETEQLVCYQVPVEMVTHVRSYVQIRGSIPLFWRQKVNSKYTPILELVQEINSHKVFAKHINEQYTIYGDNQVILNLINKKGYELPLGNEFRLQVNHLNDSRLKYVHFDFHEECKQMRYDRLNILVNQIEKEIKEQSYFMCTIPCVGEPTIAKKQKGVVRTNCIDCLDRTNVVQSVLAKYVLIQQLQELGVIEVSSGIDSNSEFEQQYKNIWADNADVISLLYSGTGALKTDYTRTGKRTRRGAIQDGINSCIRYVKNNFMDGSRQDAYDLFLGNYRPKQHQSNDQIQQGGRKEHMQKSKLRQPHIIVIAILVMTGGFYSGGILFTNEIGVLIRMWMITTFIGILSLAMVIHRFGTELVDLPRLVPVDYIHDRNTIE